MLEDAVEFIEAVVADLQLALAALALAQQHTGTEFIGQAGFEFLDVRVLGSGRRLRSRFLLQLPYESLGGTHTQSAFCYLACRLDLFCTSQCQQCTRMTHFNFTALQHSLDAVIEIQQAQYV